MRLTPGTTAKGGKRPPRSVEFAMAHPEDMPDALSERSAAVSALTRRPYLDASDLEALLEFASRSLAERHPLGSTWHPGDIAWELRDPYDARRPIELWERKGAVEAIAWFVGPGQLWLEATSSGEPWLPDIIARVEDLLLRGRSMGRATTLSVRAFQGDQVRIAGLSRLGFERAGPESVHFELDLAQASPEVELPLGFAVRDSVGIDPERRAASHRDAWSALDHIGVANARSTFSASAYESLRASPGYRPDLDLVVVAPDGALAANCICWSDELSGVGIFEPMGTHPDFRGRKLARALLAEGLRRLRGLGLRRVRISTAHFNTAAISAYSSLFQPLDRSFWWSKVLAPRD